MAKTTTLALAYLAVLGTSLLAGCGGDEPGTGDTETRITDGTETRITTTFHPGFVYRGPEDECVEREGKWQVDLAGATLVATPCVAATRATPHQHPEQRSVALGQQDIKAIRDALAAIRRAPEPVCVTDVGASTLVLERPSGSESFIDPYGGCGQRAADVVELDSLSALVELLRSLGES